MDNGFRPMGFPKPSLAEQADDILAHVYYDVLGPMNRAARRTAKGKQLVAEAKVKALEARVEFLEDQLKHGSD